MGCDNCGRAAFLFDMATAEDGTSFCSRADCRAAYRKQTDTEYTSLRDRLSTESKRHQG